MKIFIVFALFLCIATVNSCTHPKTDSPIKVESNVHVNLQQDTFTPLLQRICSELEYSYLYGCNTKDSLFQIELQSEHPYKDYVILTALMQGNELDSFRYIRINWIKPNYSSKSTKGMRLIKNPITGDSIYFHITKPKQFRMPHHRETLGKYLLEDVWKIESKRDECGLDPETWALTGRKGDDVVQIKRCNFRDTVFYSNIQILLDVCKVKDYRFPEN